MIDIQTKLQVRGLRARIARALGITHSAVSQWREVPADRVIVVAEISGIAKEELRPDIYPSTVVSDAGFARGCEATIARMATLYYVCRSCGLAANPAQSSDGLKLASHCARCDFYDENPIVASGLFQNASSAFVRKSEDK